MPDSTAAAGMARLSFLKRLRQSWRKRCLIKKQQQQKQQQQRKQQHPPQQQNPIAIKPPQPEQQQKNMKIPEEQTMPPLQLSSLSWQQDDIQKNKNNNNNNNDSFSTCGCTMTSTSSIEDANPASSSSSSSQTNTGSTSASPVLVSATAALHEQSLRLPTKVAPLRNTETARRLQLFFHQQQSTSSQSAIEGGGGEHSSPGSFTHPANDHPEERSNPNPSSHASLSNENSSSSPSQTTPLQNKLSINEDRAWANLLVQRVCRPSTTPPSTPKLLQQHSQQSFALQDTNPLSLEDDNDASSTTTDESLSFPTLTHEALAQFDQHLQKEQQKTPNNIPSHCASTSLKSLSSTSSSQYTTVTASSQDENEYWEELLENDDEDQGTDEHPAIVIELDRSALERASSTVTSIYEEITIASDDDYDEWTATSSLAYTEELVISQDEPLSFTRQRWISQVETWDTMPSDLEDHEDTHSFFEEETVVTTSDDYLEITIQQEPGDDTHQQKQHDQETPYYSSCPRVTNFLPTDKAALGSHMVVNLTFLAHPLAPSTVERMMRQAWDMLCPGGKLYVSSIDQKRHDPTIDRGTNEFSIGETLQGSIPWPMQAQVKLVEDDRIGNEQLSGEMETLALLKANPASRQYYERFHQARQEGSVERWEGVKPLLTVK